MTPHEQRQPKACLGGIAAQHGLSTSCRCRALAQPCAEFETCVLLLGASSKSCLQGFSIITESLHGVCSKSYMEFTRSPSHCTLAIILTSSTQGSQDQMACHRRLTRHTEVATQGTTELFAAACLNGMRTEQDQFGKYTTSFKPEAERPTFRPEAVL